MRGKAITVCPTCEREVPNLSERIPGEKEKAEAALVKLPVCIRGFYEAHYQIIGSKPVGTFMGLVCRVCNRWQEYNHDDDCPVAKLEDST